MTGYGYSTYSSMEPSSDHVCRPVIIDAEGRKHPIVSYTGTTFTPAHSNTDGNYVAKTETYVERVHSPLHYGNGQYHSSGKMGQILPQEDPHQFNHQVHNRPQKVEEFITQVQTEIPYSTATYLHRPISTGYINTENYVDYNHNNGHGHDDYNHNRAGYGYVSPTEETRLTKPTNDINTTMEYLKEVATMANPHLGNTSPTTIATATTTATYRQPRLIIGVPPRKTSSDYANTISTVETITSSEAKRRYGHTTPSSILY